MTIEEANELALRAALTDNLAGIRKALEARAVAIGKLTRMAPSVELATRFSAAIEAGEEIRRAILAIKYRAGLENARLERLKGGLIAGISSPRGEKVDCHG